MAIYLESVCLVKQESVEYIFGLLSLGLLLNGSIAFLPQRTLFNLTARKYFCERSGINEFLLHSK